MFGDEESGWAESRVVARVWGDDRESCEEGRGALGRIQLSWRHREESRSFAYLRPNLLYTRKFVIVHSTFSASSEE